MPVEFVCELPVEVVTEAALPLVSEVLAAAAPTDVLVAAEWELYIPAGPEALVAPPVTCELEVAFAVAAEAAPTNEAMTARAMRVFFMMSYQVE
jgi:hypothetical protein